MKLISNIECLRLPIVAGQSKIYFPFSTPIQGVKVDRVVIPAITMLDPYTGRNVMKTDNIAFLTLLDITGQTIVKECPTVLFSEKYIDTPIEAELSRADCYVTLTEPAAADGEIIIYLITYTDVIDSNYTTRSLTIKIPSGYNGPLKPFIDGHYGTLKQIAADVPFFFLTLKDLNGRTFDAMAGALFARDMSMRIYKPFLFDGIDLNWQDSMIVTSYPISLTLFF